MTTLITLVLPIGGDAGPFNLYSNVGGYAIPFETNVSASALQAGYTTSLVPDGTTIIRVTSVGVCTNSIDITVGLTPTTTTTSSSTSTSTSSSTTTSVPTTTTTTTCACLYGTVTIDQFDIDASDDGTVYVQYQDCDGHGFCDPGTPCVGGVPYTVAGVYPNDICILNTSTPNCPINIYIITGGLCNISEGGSTVTLGGCCTEFTTTTTTTVAPTTTTSTTQEPGVLCTCYTLDYTPPLSGQPTGVTTYSYTNCAGEVGNINVYDLFPEDVCAQEGSIVKTTGDGNGAYEPSINDCCIPGGTNQIRIQNLNEGASSGPAVTDVTVNNAGLVINIGSFPIYGGQSASGLYGGPYAGLSQIIVSLSDVTNAPVNLFSDGILIDCIIGSTPSVQFTNVDLSLSQDLRITLGVSGQSCI
jgi:hypothetical protein